MERGGVGIAMPCFNQPFSSGRNSRQRHTLITSSGGGGCTLSSPPLHIPIRGSSTPPMLPTTSGRTSPTPTRPLSPNLRPSAQRIGRGASGSVFSAVELNGRAVAVKVFETTSSERAKQAEAEISVMKKLCHPNIVQLIDVDRTQTRVVMRMELTTKGDLFQEITRRGFFTEMDAAPLFCQLLEAVNYLHGKNIVHRDLKPENVLLNGDEYKLEVKLADFGLARDISTEVLFGSCGSKAYAAPEVLWGRAPHTLQCDTWSLGVILYVMLSGNNPFQDFFTYEEQMLSASTLFESSRWDSVSSEAKDLIWKMIDVDPHRRLTVDKCLGHPWILSHSF